MSTPERAWLQDFALACRYATLGMGFQTNNCIQITRLGLDVLEHYGVANARPQPVTVIAYNEVAYRLKEQGVPVERWPPDAWSLGVGERRDGGRGWDGHLVIILRDKPRRTLIDLSADQLARPAKGIHVEGPVLMDIEGLWTPRDPRFVVTDGKSIIQYQPLPPAGAGNWQDSPDWTDKYLVHDELAAMVIRVLDEKYPKGGEA